MKSHQDEQNLPRLSREESFEFVPCGTCGLTGAPEYIRMADYLYGVPGTFTIAKCLSCRLLFTNPRPKPNLIDSLYSNYYNGSVALLGPQNQSISERMKKNTFLRKTYHHVFGNYSGEVLSKTRGRVLDIGCGMGTTLDDLARLGCEVLGIEPNPGAVKMCNERGLNVECALVEDMIYPENYFDTVILFHVIEHLASPRNILQKIFHILKPSGRVFIACPNADSYLSKFFGEYWAGWHLPFHFYHFTPQTISTLIGLTAFEIVSLKARTSDLVLHKSLIAFLRGKRRDVKWDRYLPLIKSFYFRLLTMLLFRPLDMLLLGKGEFLQVELRKPAKSL
jgi:2-polyprenyl-3-methyl-5-hydroxy-6-metoxy-1,4-benzoquinol methylase